MKMASCSKHVSFLDAEYIEVEAAEDSEESDEDVLDYTESLSEGDFWSSSDDDQAEFFERLLDGAYFGSSTPVKRDAVDRYSLLCFDKDILRNEEQDGKNSVSHTTSTIRQWHVENALIFQGFYSGKKPVHRCLLATNFSK